MDELVNEVIPESFESFTFERSTITEIDDDRIYKKINYPFLGMEYVYFTEEGELNLVKEFTYKDFAERNGVSSNVAV